jgi:transcription initiation factor TFIIIB Brf1 subunit/transcription initiation factor TFIIB
MSTDADDTRQSQRDSDTNSTPYVDESDSSTAKSSSKKTTESDSRWRHLRYEDQTYRQDTNPVTGQSITPIGVSDVMQGQTRIRPADAPPHKRSRFRWLKQLNDGVRSDEWRSQQLDDAAVRAVTTLANQIECTQHQRDRSRWLMMQFDHDELFTTASYEAIALAVITLVCNEDNRRVRGENQFENVMTDAQTTRSELRAIRQAIRETDVWQQNRRRE